MFAVFPVFGVLVLLIPIGPIAAAIYLAVRLNGRR